MTVAVAKGKNGKRFRTLGKAKVNSKGLFTLRFTSAARHLPHALLVQGQRQRGPRDVVCTGLAADRSRARCGERACLDEPHAVAIVEDHGALRIFLRDA